MELHLLIADSHEAQREHVCTVFSTSLLVTRIDTVTTSEELYQKLTNNPAYFVVVHQSLITDMSLLPNGHFIILASQPDRNIVKAAREHGIRGYFLEHPLPLEGLLLAALTLHGKCWLLDLALSSWAFDNETSDELPPVATLLTDREQEVFALWNENLPCYAIAEQMGISEKTVKKHLENIRKKLREHDAMELMR
jgi:DNA-binding NarL/FixJ family response regulator